MTAQLDHATLERALGKRAELEAVVLRDFARRLPELFEAARRAAQADLHWVYADLEGGATLTLRISATWEALKL